MRSLERGSVLILGLLVSTLLALVGMGIASLQVARRTAGESALLRVQARAAALSGVEDARLKLQMDPDFPPGNVQLNHDFSYGEREGERAYFVRVNREFAEPPYQLIRIWSTGVVGETGSPLAHATFYSELDVSPLDRLDGKSSNPRLYHPILLREVSQ